MAKVSLQDALQRQVSRLLVGAIHNAGIKTQNSGQRWPPGLVAVAARISAYWVGADSGGLYVKRNAWNLLHPALLIPWANIQSANEVTHKDLVRNSGSAAGLARGPRELHPFMAAAQGISGPLLELKISEPDASIVAQLVAFDQALPFLQSKMKPTKSQELKQGSAAISVDY